MGADSSQEAGPTSLVAALADDTVRAALLATFPASIGRARRARRARPARRPLGGQLRPGHWESGWSVCRVEEDGRIVVARDGVEFWAPAAGVRAETGPIRSGEPCRVRVAKELRSLVPGFYVAIGDDASDADHRCGGPDPLVRYYWHLTAGTAARFVATATTLLNESRLPFRLKVLRHPYAYHRADAGVLYLRRRDRSRLEVVIGRIYSAVASGLRPDVPLFTKRLADGLGFAEDPDGSLSFGQHRCRIVAESLWQSFQSGEFDRGSSSRIVGFGIPPCGPGSAPTPSGTGFRGGRRPSAVGRGPGDRRGVGNSS